MARTQTAEPTRTATRREARSGNGRGSAGLNGYVLSLQRTAGNAAVQRMLAPAPASPPPGAGPEREPPAGEAAVAAVPDSVAEHAAAIDADTRASIGAVRTASQRRRTEWSPTKVQVRQGVDAGFGGAIGRAGSAVERAIGRVTGWLRGTARSVDPLGSPQDPTTDATKRVSCETADRTRPELTAEEHGRAPVGRTAPDGRRRARRAPPRRPRPERRRPRVPGARGRLPAPRDRGRDLGRTPAPHAQQVRDSASRRPR